MLFYLYNMTWIIWCLLIYLLSYDFSYNISVGLFHDKKCCNNINLFPCIFVRFIVMGLVLSGGDLIKTTKSHMRSTCQKLKSQVPIVEVEESCASCASCFHDSSNPWVTHEFHWLEDFWVWPICPSLILCIPSLPTKMVGSLLREKL